MAFKDAAVPTKGARFLHRFRTDGFNQPLVFEVTEVALGMVYYKGIYNGKLQRRGSMCCPVEAFDRYCKEVIER